MNSQILISQIYFDEKSQKQLDPDFIPHKNEIKDDFFENSVIRKMYADGIKYPIIGQSTKYIGVTSWKMNEKTNVTGQQIIDHIQNDIQSGAEKDAYIYCPINTIDTQYDFSVDPPLLHGTIREPDIWYGHKRRVYPFSIDQALNDSKVLPFDLFDGKWQYCYNNFWVAKWNVFDQYCKTVLLPVMDFISSRNFPKLYKHSSGQNYTHACFTLEGLFGAFLAHSSYNFDYICRKKVRRKFHMIKVDGYKITNKP